MRSLSILLILSATCLAQNPPPNPATQAKPGVPPPTPEEKAVAAMQQRVDEQNRDRLARLSTTTRTRDPFGIGMTEDIEVKALAKELPNELKAVAVPTLDDALRSLRISGVDAEKRQAFVGARPLYEGETLTVRHKGASFSARILQVTARSIIWEDVKTGVRSIVRLSLIPNINPAQAPQLSTDSTDLNVQ